MERFGLEDVADTKVQDLSGGVRRRVQVAKMFMVDVPMVFLDEFSTGMDPILKRAVMELLRAQAAQGRTIVLTTQILTEAEELCDDILIMNQGRQIARGDLHHLKTLVERLYEVTLTFDASRSISSGARRRFIRRADRSRTTRCGSSCATRNRGCSSW